MITLMTMALERVVQRYLQIDSETREKLIALSGKVILFNIEDWGIKLYIFPCKQGVRLQSVYENAPDISIKGILSSFIKRGLSGSDAAIFPQDLEVEGDIELAQKINRIMLESHIDWEEILAVFTNDNVAHYVKNIFEKLDHVKGQIKRNIQENMTEYLQEETLLVPSRKEMEDFFSDIYSLRNDVERLEAIQKKI
ncbi:MAG: uncharacterized protein K0Q74_15 [Gammaproteobacteria bacterium]|jgi:ubiquinone biosynthesis protein UbiJ|nr:uncharacterized protein [Gammaproteobacteria bacterium]